MTLELTIETIRDETDRVRVFEMVSVEGSPLPAWEAGAHLDFETGDPGQRSYSLIAWDAPGAAPERYSVAVQREPDGTGGSAAMHALAEGDRIAAEGPKNDFAPAGDEGPVLLLAGGIGITPLISHAARLDAGGADFRLHYCARTRSAMAFADRLIERFGERVTLWLDDDNPVDLASLLGDLDPATHLYLCGPTPMMEAARAAASIPSDQIHTENFNAPLAQEDDAPFEVEINDGRVFTIPPGRSIIDVLEAEGVDLVYDCQRGDCGICQTDVIEGEPDHRDVVLSEAERASGDVMQICVSRAKSERLKLNI